MTVSGRFEGTNARQRQQFTTFCHFIAHPMHKVIATAKNIILNKYADVNASGGPIIRRHTYLKDDFKTLDDYFPRKVLPW